MKLKTITFLLTLVAWNHGVASQGADCDEEKTHAAEPALVSQQQDQAMSFRWQIQQQYKELVQQFEGYSTQELKHLVERVTQTIGYNRDYFKTHHTFLLDSLKNTIHHWMTTDVLTWNTFNEEQTQPISLSYSEREEEDEEDGDDAWRGAFMRGFNMDTSDGEENADEEEDGYYSDEPDLEAENQTFEEWQLQKLDDMFNIDVKSIDDFKPENLTVDNVRTFLTEHVEDGDYSWLVNEVMEGQLEASQDFIDQFAGTLGIPAKLLETIFGGLWFDFNWATFDITNKNYIPNTYIKTLEDFMTGAIATGVRKDVENSLKCMFLYNGGDFGNPFTFLEGKYNQFAEKRDWRNVLVTWSVYSTYRKVFEHKKYLQKLKTVKDKGGALSFITFFNKSAYLINQLNSALARAEQRYTKVYPHPGTTHIVYSAKKPAKTAKLALEPVLSRLKQVGRAIEGYRPTESKRQRKNILVPTLYFLITDRAHFKGGEHRRIFVPIELNLPFAERLLTRDPKDGVFIGDKEGNDYYFKQAKQDYVNGEVARGILKEKAEADFKKVYETMADERLVHSERVWLEILRRQGTVDFIVQSLRAKVEQTFSAGFKGTVKVYTVLAPLYSTNSVCECCTPSLIAAQNSHTEGGFLFRLAETLNQHHAGNIQFKTRGYDAVMGRQDPAKFRLTTIVTANTNFDPQAHDLTDKGQHRHTTIGKKSPPKNHLPKGTIIFPDKAIDIHQAQIQVDGNIDPYQRFFYEFVGGDLHTTGAVALPHRGITFSSGSQSWSRRVPQTVLQ